jgi:purine nucleosidase
MIPVLVDMDPGTDDALALMMLLNSQPVEVVGITTVGGNARLADTTRNALRLLEYMGHPEIPVARGAARTAQRPFHYAYDVHGARGLGIPLPSPTTRPIRSRAPAFISRMASKYRGELSIIALGPLTNIARALRKEPRIVEWTKELVVMGGAVGVAGNITPYAEFNTFNDPDAAHTVFGSGFATSLVGLDVTSRVSFDRTDAPWFTGDAVAAKLSKRIVRTWFDEHLTSPRYHLHDPLAVVAALSQNLFSWRRASIDVETEDTARRGMTAATYGSGPVRVAVAVQAEDATAAVTDILSRPGDHAAGV